VKCEDRLPYYKDSSCRLSLAATPRLQQCVRYLHGTQYMGLAYERRSNANTTAMTLEGMTDSDFAPNYGRV
jgi:hypothetical protein